MYALNKMFGSTVCFIYRSNKTQTARGIYYTFTEDTTDEIITNKDNYKEIFGPIWPVKSLL